MKNKLKRIGATAILLTLQLCANAQYKLEIVAAEDGTPLPYATVINETSQKDYSTDIAGKLFLTAEAGSDISVSYVGYSSQKLVAGKTTLLVIKLDRDSTQLGVVKVNGCKNFKKISAQNFTSAKDDGRFGGVHTSPSTLPFRVAVLVSGPPTATQLSEFSFWLKVEPFLPKEFIASPFLISCYDVDDSTGMPGNLLTENPIIYQASRKGKQTLKLDSLRLPVSSQGIYVAFQWVFDQRYQKLMRSTGTDSLQQILLQGALIDGSYTKTDEIRFYDAKNCNWGYTIRKKQTEQTDLPRKYGSIKWAAVFKQCSTR